MRTGVLQCLCFCLIIGAPAAGTETVSGAWLQRGVTWVEPPAELQLKQHLAEASILYFGKNNEFAVMYATVVHDPDGEWVSQGDGRVVYLGTWAFDPQSSAYQVEYRLASRTVLKAGEAIPGPVTRGVIRLKSNVLSFGKLKYKRDARLDEEMGLIYKDEKALLAEREPKALPR